MTTFGTRLISVESYWIKVAGNVTAAPALIFVLRLVLGSLFLFAGLSKYQHVYDFLGDIYAYRLVGASTGLFIAVVLPSLEIALGLSLLFGVLLSGSIMLVLLLTAVFVVAQASALMRGLVIYCGCTGQRQVVSSSTLGFSLSLFVIGLLLLLLHRRAQDRPMALANRRSDTVLG